MVVFDKNEGSAEQGPVRWGTVGTGALSELGGNSRGCGDGEEGLRLRIF